MNSDMVQDRRHDFGWQPRALLIASNEEQGQATAELVGAAGGRLVATVALDEAAARLAIQAPVDLLIVEAMGAATSVLTAAVDAAAHFARNAGIAVVMAIDANHIDLASAELLGGQHQLLCAPDAAERFAAIAGGMVRGTARDGAVWLNEASRDSEAVRLQRLNEEVARIAETLARLTRGEPRSVPSPASAVADRALGYRAEPGAEPPVSAAELRQTIRARRLRDQYFGDGLFEDPAWDMLLDLYAAHLERAQVSVSSLCIAAAVAPTTALRWIGRMADAGLFERHPDPFDRRRAYMALSAKAQKGMAGYFSAVKRSGGLSVSG